MAWSNEMGSLVGAIKTSHRERAHFLKESKQTTHQLLADFDARLKDTARDLKVMFAGVRDMLDKSETARMHDFKAMMEDIHGSIKSIQARVKECKRVSPKDNFIQKFLNLYSPQTIATWAGKTAPGLNTIAAAFFAPFCALYFGD